MNTTTETEASVTGLSRAILLPCLLLFGAMFNLTLVVAGLKEFVIDDLGGTVRDATLFFSVETLAYVIFAPVWGVVSDRLGMRKPLVVLGFAASAAIYFVYTGTHSIGVLLSLRFVQGAFSVMGWSTVMAMVLDDPQRGRSGRFMGLMGASLIFGVAIGAPIGGYLTRWFGARAPLTGAGLLFALLALAALLLREGERRRGHVRLVEIRAALRSTPRLVFPLAVHFVDRLAVGLFVVVFPLYLDSLGRATQRSADATLRSSCCRSRSCSSRAAASPSALDPTGRCSRAPSSMERFSAWWATRGSSCSGP